MLVTLAFAAIVLATTQARSPKPKKISHASKLKSKAIADVSQLRKSLTHRRSNSRWI